MGEAAATGGAANVRGCESRTGDTLLPARHAGGENGFLVPRRGEKGEEEEENAREDEEEVEEDGQDPP